MTAFLSVVVSGVLAGAVYGLIASGLALEFGVMRVINFSHGFLVMVAMYCYVLLFGRYHISPYVGILVVAPAAFVVGALIYRAALHPFVARKAPAIAIALVTLALSLVIQQLLLVIAGAQPRAINVPISVVGWRPFGIYVGAAQVVAAGISVLALIALSLILRSTRWGRRARAVAQDPDAARTLGIDPDRISAVAFGLGSAFAAIAAAGLVTYLSVTPQDGLTYSLVSFVVVVLGGLSSLRGAWIAAFAIGIVTNLVGFYWTSSLQTASYLVVFIVVLLLRPQGLFGDRADAGEIRG